MGATPDAPTKPSVVAAVVAFYFVISISLVFVNKTLLSSPGASIEAPIFVTW
jgi:GDP-fucose transporter C1